MGVDAGGENPRIEGLGDVVVGADLEPDDLVHLRRARGEHHDRTGQALPSHLENDLGAADVRKNPVDEDEVRLPAGRELDRLRAIGRFEHFMAL